MSWSLHESNEGLENINCNSIDIQQWRNKLFAIFEYLQFN